MSARDDVRNWWAARGFTETDTGGGCRALARQTGITHRVLVTAGDGYVPERLDEAVTVGYYDEAAGVELETFEAPSSEAAFAIVLGERFAAVLREWFTAEELAEVKRRNAAEDNQLICHSHDFCDANMAMDEAFKSFGVDPLADADSDGPSEEISRLWNAAWNHAVVRHLGGRRGAIGS